MKNSRQWKRIRFQFSKQVKWRWRSIQNWRRGYVYGPVERFRCCEHTTPFHYAYCPNERVSA